MGSVWFTTSQPSAGNPFIAIAADRPSLVNHFIFLSPDIPFAPGGGFAERRRRYADFITPGNGEIRQQVENSSSARFVSGYAYVVPQVQISPVELRLRRYTQPVPDRLRCQSLRRDADVWHLGDDALSAVEV